MVNISIAFLYNLFVHYDQNNKNFHSWDKKKKRKKKKKKKEELMYQDIKSFHDTEL